LFAVDKWCIDPAKEGGFLGHIHTSKPGHQGRHSEAGFFNQVSTGRRDNLRNLLSSY